jgi:hypothetical protein
MRAMQRALWSHGLQVRGVLVPEPDDAVPGFPDGRPARALLPVGTVGSSLWPAFSVSPESRDGRAHPLDRWSRRIGDEVARSFGAIALYPFGGPPHHPFLRWVQRAGALTSSPLGLLIDPVYGLWHAYRFALVLDRVPEGLESRPPMSGPCADCLARPCLSGCPVQAFDGTRYDVAACVRHLGDASSTCLATGCRARRSCPVGARYGYRLEHEQFHLAAFLASHRTIR